MEKLDDVDIQILMGDGIYGRAMVNLYLLKLWDEAEEMGRMGLRREATLLREKYHTLRRICEELTLMDTGRRKG